LPRRVRYLRWVRRLLLALAAFAVAIVLFGIGYAVQDPIVARYTVTVPGLQRQVRIVQLSDVHASAFDMPVARLRRIVGMANALQPDLIVLTGDYISGYPSSWTAARTTAALAPLGELSAPLGVLAVLGNHDSGPMTRKAIAATHIRLLVGESYDAGPLAIAGADDILAGSPAVEKWRKAAANAPSGKPVIAIAHEPDFMQWLPKRVPLLIAGHTHGGQIVLPLLGTLPRSPFLDAHLRGLFDKNGQTLIVSSGLGTSVLPMRIGVPPEIVEITLVPADHSVGRKSGTDR
jgi:predicted MPP superfamily phosphohydrolase